MPFSRLSRHSTWIMLAGFTLPLPLLFLAALAPGHSSWLQRIWDVGHVPLFAFWMILAMRLLPLPRTAPYIAARALGLMGTAIAIEYIQLHTGRQFSVTDMYLDACGIALGTRLSVPAFGAWPRWRRHLLDGVLLVCIGIGLHDAALAVVDRIQMYKQFPQLWSAKEWLAPDRINGSSWRKLVPDADAGQPLLLVSYGTRRFATFELTSMIGDWRNYSSLNISVLNPSQEPLNITCRVHDEPHYGNGANDNDRFNRRVTLNPGWNTVSFSLQDIESAPTTRRMEMDRIENLNCFTTSLPARQRVFYKEIWLSR